ncbi:RNA 2',3'-cyclic phosphodiesterase [Comamonas sp. NLF-1-9]|uniref:RNA 2',3'-cyclic phosphodiesterase n=1 Tax=Comamonas sp. NLF-1-9 TaxID=2853163 RepID=UPI001C466596|nr:RNA 2',3'-cyclic phosphodiesterase [Comamonas sp. NLF-1-9]QXL84135.1 RNA 2',3'-cyclic phosphodiesterase [Comamonas sp. NLF-1-9]
MPESEPAHESENAAAPRRLFTALYPDGAARAALVALRARWPGLPRRLRPPPEHLHLTLQFFGAVDARREAAWRAQLARLRFAPFDLELTRAELWHAPQGPLVVLRAAPSTALLGLHAATDALARAAGLTPEARAWKPHLTLLRDASGLTPARLAQPIRWRVQALALVWSELAARPPRYHTLAQFAAA